MKKQMKLFGRAIVVMLGLCVSGCGGESAEDVAETCMDFLEEAEFSEMRLLSTGGMIAWIDRVEGWRGQMTIKSVPSSLENRGARNIILEVQTKDR